MISALEKCELTRSARRHAKVSWGKRNRPTNCEVWFSGKVNSKSSKSHTCVLSHIVADRPTHRTSARSCVLLSGHLQDRPRYRNISGFQRSAESTNMAKIRCAAIYARFSSDKQSERSIDDQVALCRAFCERDGLRVIGVYEDRAISGASIANRFGWLKLMRDANAGKFGVVVAEALDRISRDQEDLAGIYKRLCFKQIEIRTVQDGRAEEIHVGIKGLVGALYLRDLAQKTRRGQAGVVRDGRTMGDVLMVIGRSRDKPDDSKSRKQKHPSSEAFLIRI
jgi:DNA invertase Pin-like site-specific DNA recombinase